MEPPSPEGQTPKPECARYERYCKRTKWDSVRETLLTIFTIVAASATAVMAGFTYKLASGTNKQVELTQKLAASDSAQVSTYQKSTVIENRAYVVLKGYHEPRIVPDTIWQFGAEVVNVGHTPALDVTTSRALFFNLYKEPPDAAYLVMQRSTTDSGLTMGTNIPQDLYGGSGYVGITAYDSLQQELMFAFLYVSIIYRDVFDSARHTEFCSRWDWARKEFVATKNHQHFD